MNTAVQTASPFENVVIPTVPSKDRLQLAQAPDANPGQVLVRPHRKDPNDKVAAQDIDIRDAALTLRKIGTSVCRDVVGMESMVTQLMLALLTREHVIIYSKPGTAKSLLALSLFKHFTEAKTFKVQLTKGTTEEGVVGGIDINELKEGNVTHKTEGTMVDADLVYLDEFFDANDIVLRSMLGLLNEREFRKGKQQVEAELHTAVATTNYMRKTEVTEAVLDRFIYKAKLIPTSDPLHQLDVDYIYANQAGIVRDPAESEKMKISDLSYLADLVENRVQGREITCEPAILLMKNLILDTYVELLSEERKGKNEAPPYISPRTRAKIRDVLNASAILNGRTSVDFPDLKSLKFAIPTVGDDQEVKAFDAAFTKAMSSVSKLELKALRDLTVAHEMVRNIIEARTKGLQPELSIWQKMLRIFGMTDLSEISYASIGRALEKYDVNPSFGLATKLKNGLLQRATMEEERDRKGHSLLI